MVLGLCLHYTLDYFFIFIDRDTLYHLWFVESDRACFHTNSLLQVVSPCVVDTARGFFAALNRVCLGELGALLDQFVRDLAVVTYSFGYSKVDVRR